MSGGVVAEVAELMKQFAELSASFNSGDLLSEVSQKLNQMRIIQEEVSKVMGNVINNHLQLAFSNEVQSRKPTLCEFELCDDYMRAVEYPNELYPKATLGTSKRFLKPSYSKEYPSIAFTKDKKTKKMQYHVMVASCVLNDGEEIDAKKYDVDHTKQDRFNWDSEELEIVDKKTNQRNRGAAEWIEESEIGDDVIAIDQYNSKDGLINIDAECIYRATVKNELTYFTWEPNGKYRKCKLIPSSKPNKAGLYSYSIRGVVGKQKYSINLLNSTELAVEDNEFCQ